MDATIDAARHRFLTKCRFDPALGCVLWAGSIKKSRCGEGRTGTFWFEGRNWYARRWAAKFIHGLDISDGREAMTLCRNDLCVRHLMTDFPVINTRQHWLLVNLGYGDDEPEDHKRERLAREEAEARAAIPAEERGIPDWFEAYVQTRRWRREEEEEWLAELREAGRHPDNCLCAAVQPGFRGGPTCFQRGGRA